jgi:large subunit ribosomal protein L16
MPFSIPFQFLGVIFMKRPKLRFMEKVSQYPANLRSPKIQKKLKLMRGPELVNNTVLHKQDGIVADGGGRMRWCQYCV